MSRMSSQNRWVPAVIRTEAPVLQFRKSAEDGNRTGLREVVPRLLGFNQTMRKVQMECHRNNEDSKTDSILYLADRASRYNFWKVTNLTHNSLFQSSTCFEQTRAHHQVVSCINTTSGIVTLCKWPSAMQIEQFLLDLHTGRPLTERDYTRCCMNTIDLLMMSMCLLETLRGFK